MKPPLLRAYAAMLPRLQSEESLMRVAEYQAASADYKPEHRQKIISAWQRLAEGGVQERLKPSKPEFALRLAAMGIRMQGVA